MEWVTNHWKEIVDVVAYIIAAASIIVKLTPTLKDDILLGKVVNTGVKILALFSLNKTILPK